MADQNESFETKDFGWLVAMSILFLLLVVICFWREFSTEWGPYQRQFPQLLGHYGKGEDARNFQPGIQQIWIPKIGVTDRCVTCHLGYEWSSVLPATIAEPLKPHPMNDWIAKHEFAKFGCTPCHGGDGAATTVAGAHQGGRGWDDPMLSNALAAQNGLTMNEMIQLRCNFCHRHDAATPGMDQINLAKVLFKKKKCLLCHVVESRGGATGPELTYEGDRNPELLNFAHVTGDHTMFNWNVQHLTKASAVSPNTAMPDFNFKPEESRALTLLLLSWRRLTYPPEYIPDPQVAVAAMQPSPTSTATPTPTATPVARAFRQNGESMKSKVLIFAVGATIAFSQPALSADNDIAEGHRYFVRYCASCHGTDALGDGPVAKSLATPPANLRKLGDKYGMPLPAHRIAELIDGRDTARAHGSHEMPVWGEKLYELGQGEEGEKGIGDVIAKIIAYLNTIQDRRTAMR